MYYVLIRKLFWKVTFLIYLIGRVWICGWDKGLWTSLVFSFYLWPRGPLQIRLLGPLEVTRGQYGKAVSKRPRLWLPSRIKLWRVLRNVSMRARVIPSWIFFVCLWVKASNTPPRFGGSSWLFWEPEHRPSCLAVPWGILKIRIRFVSQRGNRGKPTLETNKQTKRKLKEVAWIWSNQSWKKNVRNEYTSTFHFRNKEDFDK